MYVYIIYIYTSYVVSIEIRTEGIIYLFGRAFVVLVVIGLVKASSPPGGFGLSTDTVNSM